MSEFQDDLNVTIEGREDGPLLVCVHGLMGHTHDFGPFLEEWGKHFKVIIPDYAPNSMERAYNEVFEDEEWLVYDLGGRKIAKWLRTNFPGEKAFFAGISVGGKISIEIAETHPDIFAGAVITDVGVGSLVSSELCQFLENVLPNINLEQAWSKLRVELREKIPDRMLRILVQSHIEYKDKSVPKANWRNAGYKFYGLLKQSRMDLQWDLIDQISAAVVILKASTMSAIQEDDYQQQLEHPHIYSIKIPNSGHFIQITHQKEFKKYVRDCLLAISERKPATLIDHTILT